MITLSIKCQQSKILTTYFRIDYLFDQFDKQLKLTKSTIGKNSRIIDTIFFKNITCKNIIEVKNRLLFPLENSIESCHHNKSLGSNATNIIENLNVAARKENRKGRKT